MELDSRGINLAGMSAEGSTGGASRRINSEKKRLTTIGP
jgi:hypothetical protein